MPESPTVTLAICTYRREKVLCETIACMLAGKSYPLREVIVVDQTPTHEPETERFLREHSDRIRWVRAERPSLTAARNRVIRESDSDIIIFVDDDVVPSADFVAAHVKAHARDGVGCVTGPAPLPDETLAPAPDPRIHRRFIGWFFSGFVHRQSGPYPRPIGANMSYKRDVFAKVGLFDERIAGPAHYEDADMGFRVRAAGYQVWYDADAALVHLQERSGGCDLRSMSSAWSPDFHRNFALFLRQHAPVASWPLAYLYLAHGKCVQPLARMGDRATCLWRFLGAAISGWRAATAALQRPRHEPYP